MLLALLPNVERKEESNMVAPLIIAGVRILAPIAAKYLAGKLSKKAAVKASQELTKKSVAKTTKPTKAIPIPKDKKSILKKSREFTDKTGITGKKGRYKEARKKDGAIVGTGKEIAKDAARLYASDELIYSPALKSLGYKKGGAVKSKCKIDGIAQRGRTRAKHK